MGRGSVARRCLLATFLVVTALPAIAQRNMDPFDFDVADIRLMENRKVQNDMGISQTQRDKMNVFAKEHEKRLLAYQQSLKGVKPTDAKKQEVQAKIMAYLQTLKNNVCGVLTPAQLKRLREITLQGYGWAAVADERVGNRVGMSADQVQKVKAILSSSSQKASQIERSAADPLLAPYKNRKPKDQAEAQKLQGQVKAILAGVETKIKPQIVALRAKTIKDIQAVLTAKQRSAYTALQGRKFTPK